MLSLEKPSHRVPTPKKRRKDPHLKRFGGATAASFFPFRSSVASACFGSFRGGRGGVFGRFCGRLKGGPFCGNQPLCLCFWREENHQFHFWGTIVLPNPPRNPVLPAGTRPASPEWRSPFDSEGKHETETLRKRRHRPNTGSQGCMIPIFHPQLGLQMSSHLMQTCLMEANA